MGKSIIIYKSKYGAAKEYADLLGEKIHCEAFENSHLNPKQINSFDTVLLCGGVYASHISGISFLKRNYKDLKDKKVVIFAVGAYPYSEQMISELKRQNLKGTMSNITLFYGRGIWNEETLTFKDRLLCNMVKKLAEKKSSSPDEPQGNSLISILGKKENWIDIKYLEPVLDYLEEIP